MLHYIQCKTMNSGKTKLFVWGYDSALFNITSEKI